MLLIISGADGLFCYKGEVGEEMTVVKCPDYEMCMNTLELLDNGVRFILSSKNGTTDVEFDLKLFSSENPEIRGGCDEDLCNDAQKALKDDEIAKDVTGTHNTLQCYVGVPGIHVVPMPCNKPCDTLTTTENPPNVIALGCSGRPKHKKANRTQLRHCDSDLCNTWVSAGTGDTITASQQARFLLAFVTFIHVFMP